MSRIAAAVVVAATPWICGSLVVLCMSSKCVHTLSFIGVRKGQHYAFHWAFIAGSFNPRIPLAFISCFVNPSAFPPPCTQNNECFYQQWCRCRHWLIRLEVFASEDFFLSQVRYAKHTQHSIIGLPSSAEVFTLIWSSIEFSARQVPI